MPRPAWRFALGLVLVPPGCALAYDAVLPPPKVVLPKPMSPAESLAAIKVPAGLKVELVAAEPLVLDPVDLAWGADGRLWVVEMADYPDGMDGKGKPGGRIRVLESTRGDGRYDKATLFADHLSTPKSVLPWRKGVLVVAVPDILYLEDTDGDGKADRIDKLYTGLGQGNQQHRANGLQWGLDGWLYMANGDSGGKVTSVRTGQSIDLGRRDFRIKPDEGLLETASGQTQFGRNRDDWGNWFGCNNSNPCWHYALDDHYLRRNPHLAPPNLMVSVYKVPGPAPVFPAVKPMARFNDPYAESHFTSACGVMIYRDDLLGPDFTGNVFVSEPVHHLVSRMVLQPKGVTFAGDRAPAEQNAEFLASSDGWSRFVYTRTGPDGALYVADMYRLVIEHPKWIPEEWQKVIGDVRAGDDKGRIYRVYPHNATLRPTPRLDRADAAGLIAAHESPSGLIRDLAQQQLFWRGDKSAAPALEKIVTSSPRPEARVQALCTLDLLGALNAATVAHALKDAHAGVRRQAVRLTEKFTGRSPELLAEVVKLATDPAAPVRQQVAYTLGEWREPAAAAALSKLVRQERDPFIAAAAMSSALPHADTMLAEISAEGSAPTTLLEIAIVTQNQAALASWITRITSGPNAARKFAAMQQFVDTLGRNSQTLSQLRARAGEPLRQALTAAGPVFASARTTAASDAAPLADRVAAASILGRGPDQQMEDVKLLVDLLAPRLPPELHTAALASLGHQTASTIPERLLAGWNSYGAKTRASILELLASRVAWADRLLDWIAADPAHVAQIGSSQRNALANHSNRRVAARATKVLSAGIDQNRQKVIDDYLAQMQPFAGDPQKGRTVFTNACAACHRYGDVAGGKIGPDIAVVTDRTRPYLVTHILDPNRAVEDRMMLYTATIADGRTLSGMLVGETGNSITFAGLDGVEQVILRNDLKSLSSTGRSLMPDGLEAAIPPRDMADLIAFLAKR